MVPPINLSSYSCHNKKWIFHSFVKCLISKNESRENYNTPIILRLIDFYNLVNLYGRNFYSCINMYIGLTKTDYISLI